MANKKFTDLTQASTINETDIVATSQYSGGIWSSLKATISQIANKIVSGINYNSLNTTDKTIIGAINEAAQSGGSGGHTILDDGGTALSQEDNLQFVGVYSEDDSVNDTTKVNIVREMTQAQYELLSADEKKGIIRITDKNYVCEASEVKYSNTSVETELDSKEDWVSNGVLGAKNLNSYPYNEASGTKSGVTWTVNSDGSIKATGKATGGNSAFYCHNRTHPSDYELFLPNGTYLLSGCPSGGSSSSYRVGVHSTKNGSNYNYGYDEGNGFEFTVNGDDYSDNGTYIRLAITIYNGFDCGSGDGVLFKPMLRLVKDTDDTWRPYAMTNKELTEVVGNPPKIAGTYTLQLVVDASGNRTYSWV